MVDGVVGISRRGDGAVSPLLFRQHIFWMTKHRTPMISRRTRPLTFPFWMASHPCGIMNSARLRDGVGPVSMSFWNDFKMEDKICLRARAMNTIITADEGNEQCCRNNAGDTATLANLQSRKYRLVQGNITVFEGVIAYRLALSRRICGEGNHG